MTGSSTIETTRDNVLLKHAWLRNRFLGWLSNKALIRLLTLGPEETSSYVASRYLLDYLRISGIRSEMWIDVCDNFDDVFRSLKAGLGDIMVMPNAYENITNVYWDDGTEVIFSYYHSTPAYGLAVRDRKMLERTRIRVSSCPAVFSLVGRLGPELLAGKDIEILATDSTALAAEMVHAGLAEVAVTNEMSVSKYGLTFLSEVPGVEMLWSVFRRRE